MSNSANSKVRFSASCIIFKYCVLDASNSERYNESYQWNRETLKKKNNKQNACCIKSTQHLIFVFCICLLYLVWKEECVKLKKRNSIFKDRYITNHYFKIYRKPNTIASSDSISFKCMTLYPLQKRLRSRIRLKFSIQKKSHKFVTSWLFDS